MVQGLRSLQRKFTVMPKQVKAQMRFALAAWADAIIAQMKAEVPELSGALHDSIGWVWGFEAPVGSFAIRTFGGRDQDPDLAITIFAGSEEAYYARWQEFGTQNMPANPYFFSAVRGNKRKGRRGLLKSIRRGIKEGAK